MAVFLPRNGERGQGLSPRAEKLKQGTIAEACPVWGPLVVSEKWQFGVLLGCL